MSSFWPLCDECDVLTWHSLVVMDVHLDSRRWWCSCTCEKLSLQPGHISLLIFISHHPLHIHLRSSPPHPSLLFPTLLSLFWHLHPLTLLPSLNQLCTMHKQTMVAREWVVITSMLQLRVCCVDRHYPPFLPLGLNYHFHFISFQCKSYGVSLESLHHSAML